MGYGFGKVILLGEHSVVHGRYALAMAVERGAEVRAELRPAGPTTLQIEPWGVSVTAGTPCPGRETLQKALDTARAFYIDDCELALHAEVRLPSGAGMGSSAALGVALLRAMDEARGLQRSDHELCERSLAWERIFHGNPSGVDNAMATYGGIALFRKGEGLTRVVPRHRPRLLAGYSGSPGPTIEMVASVARQYERDPARIGKLFDAIEALVNYGKVALEHGDLKGLGQLMTINHKLLSALLLSTDTLEEMIAAALAAGALGAKVTGGGGGGCMLALVDSDESHARVKHTLEALGKIVYEL